MEAPRDPSGREGTLGTVADHVVLEVHPAEKERSIWAERTGNVDRVALWDAISGVLGLVEDAMNASVPREGLNVFSRTDNRLEAMLQGLVNNAIDGELK